MITIIGTHHQDFRENDLSIEERVKVDRFDRIFTEGFSKEGLRSLREMEAFGSGVEAVNRGPEPELMDEAETEVVYLDEGLSEELLNDLMKASRDQHEICDIYPFDGIEESLIKSNVSRRDYIDFFRDLRDMDYSEDHGFSDYAALSNEGFITLMADSAEQLDRPTDTWHFTDMDYSDEFIEGLEEHNIGFNDYVRVFGENRTEVQDRRDREWYRQIDEQIEEDERILLVAGIDHALDYEGTVRNLLEQDYDTSVSPFRRF